MEFLGSIEDLRAVYGAPSDTAVKKQLSQIDAHTRRFLEVSPFVMIGTQDRDGNGDVTPKGDGPGFVKVIDDVTIAIPDRPGNNRLDTWENIIKNPAVGLLFMVPGMNETLRINGEARLTVDETLCAELGMNGRPALSVMVVKVREVYMHCAKAYIRSKLWKSETWPDRALLPTLGEILRDQVLHTANADDIDAGLDKAYKENLW